MLRQTAASLRGAVALTSTQRISSCQIPAIRRQISFNSWRKKPPQQALPVYFTKSTRWYQQIDFRQRIGYVTRGGSCTQSQSYSQPFSRRAVFAGLVFYACWNIFATVVIDPFLDWADRADREWDSMSDKEKQEADSMVDDDEPILFLPFPFTTSIVGQPPYKGTDPEWETFVKISHDPKHRKQIQGEASPGSRTSIVPLPLC